MARKLARERDDLSRDLLQLQNDTRQLHSRLLQQLPLESCPEELVEAVEALHLRSGDSAGEEPVGSYPV